VDDLAGEDADQSFEKTVNWAIVCIDACPNKNEGSSDIRSIKILNHADDNGGLINDLIYIILLAVILVVSLFMLFRAWFKRKIKKEIKIHTDSTDSSKKEIEIEDASYGGDEKEAGKDKAQGADGDRAGKKIKDSVLNMLDDKERMIVKILEEADTEITQAYIYKMTRMPKASLSDIMRRLESRNIIERRTEGRTKWVKFKEWVFED